jgi:PIN domain nuclease of toxin-antitoxin system
MSVWESPGFSRGRGFNSYIIDTHALVWFLERSTKQGKNARNAILDPDSSIIIPSIVLAEIKFLFAKNRFSTSLEKVFGVIEDDSRCIIHPLDVDTVNMIPTTLEIQDAIITATELIFDRKLHPGML